MNNQDSHTWVDRAEYERLKSLEASMSSNGIVSSKPHYNPINVTSIGQLESDTEGILVEDDESTTKSKEKVTKILLIILAISAIASFAYSPLTIVFVITGILSLVHVYNDKRVKKSSAAKAVVGGLLVVAILPFMPVLFLLVFFAFWTLGCNTGIGSCRTA